MAPPHDAPTAGELLAAVREFLERDVLSALEGRARFHALVAVNVLGMVEREVGQGAAQERAHRARLAALGHTGDAGLAAAIRAGDFDDREDELKASLIDTVRAKLLVANPAYLPGPPLTGTPR